MIEEGGEGGFDFLLNDVKGHSSINSPLVCMTRLFLLSFSASPPPKSALNPFKRLGGMILFSISQQIMMVGDDRDQSRV